MSGTFDPYHEWLAIPAETRPPSHYGLLGLSEFDDDEDRLESAFHQRYARVRKYQVGEHSGDAVRLLRELSKAYECLRDAKTRAQYNDTLPGAAERKRSQAERPVKRAPAPDSGVPAKVTPPALSARPATASPTPQAADQPPATTAPASNSPATANPAPISPAPISPAPISPAPISSAPGAPAAAPASGVVEQAVWRVFAPDGSSFGPATKRQLDDAVAQGRIDPDFRVSHSGWAVPCLAAELYTELAAGGGMADLMGVSTPAAASAALLPYRPGPRTTEATKARYAMVALLGLLQLLLLGCSAMTTAWQSLPFAACVLIGFLGIALTAVSLMEWTPLFEIPLGRQLRIWFGNRGARQCYLAVGLFLVVSGYLVMGAAAFGGVRSVYYRWRFSSRRRPPAFAPQRPTPGPTFRGVPNAPLNRTSSPPNPAASRRPPAGSRSRPSAKLQIEITNERSIGIGGLPSKDLAGAWKRKPMIVVAGAGIRTIDPSTGRTRNTLSHNNRSLNNIAVFRQLVGRQFAASSGNLLLVFGSGAAKEISASQGGINDLAVSTDGKYVATAAESVRLWDAEQMKLVAEFQAPQQEGGSQDLFTNVAFQASSRQLACADSAGGIHILKTPDLSLTHQLESYQRKPANDLVFSGLNEELLVSVTDHCVQLWDADKGKNLSYTVGQRAGGAAVDFSPSGRLLAKGGFDYVVIHDPAEKMTQLAYLANVPCTHVAWLDDNMLAIMGRKGVLTVIRVKDL